MSELIETHAWARTIRPHRDVRRRHSVSAPSIKLAADLRCLMCGHYLGEVVVTRRGRSVTILSFDPGPLFQGGSSFPARCDKCDGALGLDEVHPLPRGLKAAVFGARTRGGPRLAPTTRPAV